MASSIGLGPSCAGGAGRSRLVRHIAQQLGPMVPLLCAAALAAAAATPPVLEVMKAESHGGAKPFTSYWSPAIVHTRSNKTVVFAQADTLAARARKGPFGERMATSTDFGETFGPPVTVAHWYEAAPQFLYSADASDTILMFRSTHDAEAAVDVSSTMPAAATAAPPPAKPGMDTSKPIWANELPKLSAKAIASCNTAISKSTDGAPARQQRQAALRASRSVPILTAYGKQLLWR
jgi:hypothetical protein